MFTVAPECLVGILFNECMNEREAILIKGAQSYCAYTGYADTFRFAGDYVDDSPVIDGVKDREIIAIDAMAFSAKNK